MKLLFVYNANSGFMSSVLDGAHKIISPGTYNCSLCKLTFGNFGEKEIWKEFREKSEIEMQFYHKDELAVLPLSKEYVQLNLPAVLLHSDSKSKLLISAEELNKLKDAGELIEWLNRLLTPH